MRHSKAGKGFLVSFDGVLVLGIKVFFFFWRILSHGNVSCMSEPAIGFPSIFSFNVAVEEVFLE